MPRWMLAAALALATACVTPAARPVLPSATVSGDEREQACLVRCDVGYLACRQNVRHPTHSSAEGPVVYLLVQLAESDAEDAERACTTNHGACTGTCREAHS